MVIPEKVVAIIAVASTVAACILAAMVISLRRKLRDELPDGALVLDYSAQLGDANADADADANADAGGAAGAGRGAAATFHLLCTVSAPVSWDGRHTFFVFEARRTAPAVEDVQCQACE